MSDDAVRSPALAGRPARILVVDDDEPVRRSVSRGLRAAGYLVATAESAEDALDVVARECVPFDLVVSDVVMRAMSGVALADRLREMNPSARIILISGYPGTHFDDRAPGFRRFDLLQKPFTPVQLAAKVGETLARSGAL
jgi:two-component system, cell cycle sensor histidine kinase and response regulator CckA